MLFLQTNDLLSKHLTLILKTELSQSGGDANYEQGNLVLYTGQVLFEHLRIGNHNSYWSIKTVFLMYTDHLAVNRCCVVLLNLTTRSVDRKLFINTL